MSTAFFIHYTMPHMPPEGRPRHISEGPYGEDAALARLILVRHIPGVRDAYLSTEARHPKAAPSLPRSQYVATGTPR